MGKYGQTAKLAVQNMKRNTGLTPQSAWKNAAQNIFETQAARKKGCPKSTFLGLCEDGKVKGIAAGSYTRSYKNKDYALTALELLKENSAYKSDQKLLWQKVIDGTNKVHNQQMDVVITLFEEGLLE